jgi:hypothetical protein
VHGGYYPSFKESDLSINSSLEYLHYILALLENKKYNQIHYKIMEAWFSNLGEYS